ncbi:alpha/beta hydrolase [Streptomyces sp. NPDC003656]
MAGRPPPRAGGVAGSGVLLRPVRGAGCLAGARGARAGQGHRSGRGHGRGSLVHPRVRRRPRARGRYPRRGPRRVRRAVRRTRGVRPARQAPGHHAPTLVVAGREDPATPIAHARELADGIPGASLTEVAHAAHLANVERPGLTDTTVRRLSNLLASQRAPRRWTCRRMPVSAQAPDGMLGMRSCSFQTWLSPRRSTPSSGS